jgi:hypothetical protein
VPLAVCTNETRPIRGAGSLDSLTRAALQQNWGSATKTALLLVSLSTEEALGVVDATLE